MEVRLAATTPTASDDAVVRILIAIELSKKSWIVGANTPLKAKTSRFQLAAGDWKALLKLIEQLRHQVAREGRPGVEIEVISCYEAGYDGFWLHHLLEAHGVHNHVLDPASLLVNRRAKSAKTDGIDASGCNARSAAICAANRMPAVWCAFRASRRRTPSGCIASASGWSRSGCSTSTASKACARSTASMIINLCGPTARRSLKVCELVTGAPCRLG